MSNYASYTAEDIAIPTAANGIVAPRIHVSNGNSKVGRGGRNGRMWTFSTLAGNKPVETPCGTVTGTCAGTCAGCYAMRIQNMNRPTVLTAWAENTQLVRNGLFMDYARDFVRAELAKQNYYAIIDGDGYVWRHHVSGEYECDIYGVCNELRSLAALARLFPVVEFYTYTKNRRALRDLLEWARVTDGDGREWYDMPNNLTVNYSAVEGERVPRWILDHFPVFKWVSISYELRDGETACPAYVVRDKTKKYAERVNGHVCTQCGRCWTAKAGEIRVCFNHK